MTMHARSGAPRRALALLAAALLVGACGKKDKQGDEMASATTPPPAAAAATPAPAAAPALQVADVALGRAIGADKKVTGETTDFRPRDTIFGSVHTTGSGQSAQLTARWTYQDGQTVKEQTESISPSGDAWTEFHIEKPSGWPAGKYTLHVLLNGSEVQTKDFEVKK